MHAVTTSLRGGRAAGARMAGHPTLLLQRQAGNAAVSAVLQRNEDSEVEDEEGGSFGGGVSGQAEGAPMRVQRMTSKRVKTTVKGSGDAGIFIEKKPEADIGADHGAGIVGWTKPAYNTAAVHGRPAYVEIETEMSFLMDLASEYTGAKGQVLKDHEMGHLNIGMARGRKHYDRELVRGARGRQRRFHRDQHPGRARRRRDCVQGGHED